MPLDLIALLRQAWVGSAAQYIYAAILLAGVVSILVWAGWCLWMQRAERRMLSDVLAMMGQPEEAAAADPPDGPPATSPPAPTAH